jgi:hypothetical protein
MATDKTMSPGTSNSSPFGGKDLSDSHPPIKPLAELYGEQLTKQFLCSRSIFVDVHPTVEGVQAHQFIR